MKISGTGSALPKQIVTNEMLSQILDTSDEWVRTRTGVGRPLFLAVCAAHGSYVVKVNFSAIS